MKLFPALFFAVWTLASQAYAQSVLDVDRTLGPYTTVQSAVNAASPGDIIRITGPAQFAERVILDGKGLSIVARPGGTPSIYALEIRNLDSAETVVLAGLRISSSEFGYQSMVIEDCDGPVRIVDCSIFGDVLAGVYLRGSSDVTFHESDVAGQSGLYEEGADGMRVSDTQVTLWNCEIRGASSWYGARGGNAITAYLSDVYVHGCTVTGGGGSRSYVDRFGCQAAYPGGSGVVSSAGGTTRLLDTAVRSPTPLRH